MKMMMAAITLAGLALSGCGSQPSTANAGAAAGATDGEAARANIHNMMEADFNAGGADWVERWWKNGVENGGLLDTDPIAPGSDTIKVTFKSDYNDPGKSGTGTAKGHALAVTIDGKPVTLTLVRGKDAGVAALAGRRRCVLGAPDGAPYCTAN